MRRLAALVLMLPLRASAQDPSPSPHWLVELEASESFDNVQRGTGLTHTFHSAHITLILDVESPDVHDGQLRIKTARPQVIGAAGTFEGGRDATTRTSEANLAYTATVRRDQVELALSYDGPERWALDFGIGLHAKGTNIACIVDHARRTCATSEVPPLAPFGWTLDAKHGGRITRQGDAWIVSYAHDDTDSAPGETRHHRELAIRLRPRLPSDLNVVVATPVFR
ncbi:MAG: hypothetical protein JWO36_4615 [Myxococcales bacterium]|nr:hypothetical protein [Myxococcales bacterium]